MEQIKEAVYLINDERYLHLRENSAGVGFATYNKVTGKAHAARYAGRSAAACCVLTSAFFRVTIILLF